MKSIYFNDLIFCSSGPLFFYGSPFVRSTLLMDVSQNYPLNQQEVTFNFFIDLQQNQTVFFQRSQKSRTVFILQHR